MEQNKTKKDPEFLAYVLKVNEGKTLNEAFELSLKQIDELDIPQLKRIGLKTYAADKWSIHKIIQHLIDWERVWCYRAILFARNEGHIPEALDQEIMGTNSNADEVPIEHLIKELKILRQSSQLMFNSFNQEILDTNCEFFEYEMPLYTIGLTITAHQIHHFTVIKEKYLPLDD